MIRGVPVPDMVNLLAPILKEERLVFESLLTFFVAERNAVPEGKLTFNRWLALQHERLTDPFTIATRRVLGQIATPLDARLFAETILEDPTFEPLQFLNMLMTGIQFWNEGQQETPEVEPANRWLLNILADRHADGLALLFGHFYNLYRESGLFPCERLPDRLEVLSGEERSMYFAAAADRDLVNRTAKG